jgi:hypothetical protein
VIEQISHILGIAAKCLSPFSTFSYPNSGRGEGDGHILLTRPSQNEPVPAGSRIGSKTVVYMMSICSSNSRLAWQRATFHMDTARQVLFACLFALVALWYILELWVLNRLQSRHASTYKQIGSPSLFWNNSTSNKVSFMAFVFSSRSRDLGDSALTRIALFMRAVFMSGIILGALALVVHA